MTPDKQNEAAQAGDEASWVGHEWKMRGFYSDECIHCGTIAVDGHNGPEKDKEHCVKRAESRRTPQ